MKEQILDTLEVERLHGITIKSQSVRLNYNEYILNMIDTPGHVDFSYEVSRSLSACEGALLVVDASQGVEAQTIAHSYIAVENNLKIIPIINKIDLPTADVEKTKTEIKEIGIDVKDAIPISAKLNLGIDRVLNSIVEKIPHPEGKGKPLKALIIDSWYDSYKGVVCLMRVFDGEIKTGKNILMYSTKKTYEIMECGVFTPKKKVLNELSTGSVGYMICGIKNIKEARVGDTITDTEEPTQTAISGFKKSKPCVFAGIYPTDPRDFPELKKALEKLQLNDAALSFEPDSSTALGYGFRCGFLGLLHLSITKERLETEFGLDVVIAAPTVVYRVKTKEEKIIDISNPAHFPDNVLLVWEPYVSAEIITPTEFLGNTMKLLKEKRGIQKDMTYISSNRVIVKALLPFSEIITDFHERLQTYTRGHGSFDYEFEGYKPSDVVKLNILINGKSVDALSVIVCREKAYIYARKTLQSLRKLVPRQLFEVRLQASIGKKIVAKEEIKALRKNVTAKCYGGDITRKMKLLEKQKAGKKRMKKIGDIKIDKEAFFQLLGTISK
jgi:GTP-binding protein LepA